MRELRFDGLSPDGTRLILAGMDGQKYSVVIDERIEAAVRRDRARMGQVEIEQAGMLRPREIQARIRSGQTAEDVAAASGLPIEHIRRFEGPVLTERAWVAQQAQATEVRRPGGDIELGDLVSERLHAEGVDAADIAWDAWRRDDGTWVVIATFPLPPNTHVATWTYDSGSRTMTVVDDNAGALSAIDLQAPLRLAASRPMLATVVSNEDDDLEEDDVPAVVTSLPAWSHDRAVVGQGSEPAGQDESGPDADEPIRDRGLESVGAGDGADGTDDPEDLADPADLGQAADDPEDVMEDGDAAEFADPSVGEVGDTFNEDAGDRDPDQAGAGDLLAGDENEEDRTMVPVDSGPTADAEDVPLFQTPTPPAARPTGKPSVPSFDDILFGPGTGK